MDLLTIIGYSALLLLLLFIAIIVYNIRMPYSRNIDPKGKYVLVTGAASGVGRGTVEKLLAVGCTKIFACDINEKMLLDNFSSNPKVVCITVDISKVEQVQNVATVVAQHLPSNEQLFGIINCAGILSSFTPLLNVKEKDMERMFKVNVFGMINMNKYLFPHLQRPDGVIINISSMSGAGFMPLLGIYPATKYAVRGYSEALRRELALLGIRVITIYPGGINSGLTAQLIQSVDKSEYDFWDSKLIGSGLTNSSSTAYIFNPDEIGFFITNCLFNSRIKREIILDKLWFLRIVFYSTYAFLPNAVSDWIYTLPIKLNDKRKQQ